MAFFSVPVLEGIRGQQNVNVPPCRRRVDKIVRGFSKGSLILLIIRKQDNVCDKGSSSDEYQSTDVAEGIRQAPTPPLEINFEI